jgi:N-acetylglucosamine kinase-like BadF-type ATPase
MGVTPASGPDAVIVAVDGGASKTDVAVVNAMGEVLGRTRGSGCSHLELGFDSAARVVDESVLQALNSVGAKPTQVIHAACYLTAIDMDEEQQELSALLGQTLWSKASLTVENDLFPILRAGTESADAAVVVCGSGINGLARNQDGRVARVLSQGRSSGDWGGGTEIAEEVLWLAARAEDGRGAPTQLRTALMQWCDRPSIHEISIAVHKGELSPLSWRARVPEIMEIAADGDEVAIELLRNQGREIGLLAQSLLNRLGLSADSAPIVIGGGIGVVGNKIIMSGLASIIGENSVSNNVVLLSTDPIFGAIDLAVAGK